MDWLQQTLDELEQPTGWGYRPGAPAATEPAALAALALAGHGRAAAARRAGDWLLAQQTPDGSLGIFAANHAPHWATSQAVLAWQAIDRQAFAQPTSRAIDWMYTVAGTISERNPDLGHDTTLRGWPWVEGTHSWLEPTSWCVLALKATDRRQHPRVREAVKLLIDRQLPGGGSNYGNTSVLGQVLCPHLEPSGLSLLALSGETDANGRIARSLDYVVGAVNADVTSASLGYALLGLAAHDRLPPDYAPWLAKAAARSKQRDSLGPRLTLLALAALGTKCPLITVTREVSS